MNKMQEIELNRLKTKYQGYSMSVEEVYSDVIVNVESKDYKIKKKITINYDGDVYEDEIKDIGMPLLAKIVLLMIPVYGILFFSLDDDFMIPIFILGAINLFMAYCAIA